jgi:ABC-type Fe3+/spermidine/putrescine transport system ATPase subunit
VFVATRPEETVPAGKEALAAVRPETINLSATKPSSDTNFVSARVAGVSHFGDVLQYVVTAGSRDLLVQVSRTDPSRFAVGESVWCTWAAEDVYLFSARQADLVLAGTTNA